MRARCFAQMLVLNFGCDLGDLAATMMERRHNLPRIALMGSAVVQSAGLATWAYALAKSRPSAEASHGTRLRRDRACTRLRVPAL